MQITIQPDRNIDGVIMAPPSKSMAHRAVLCAALAKGTSHIGNLEFSKDVFKTPDCAEGVDAFLHKRTPEFK